MNSTGILASFSARPAPMIAPTVQWEVLTGILNTVAIKMAQAPPSYEENALIESKLVIPSPKVLVVLFPQKIIPIANATAPTPKVQKGISTFSGTVS